MYNNGHCKLQHQYRFLWGSNSQHLHKQFLVKRRAGNQFIQNLARPSPNLRLNSDCKPQPVRPICCQLNSFSDCKWPLSTCMPRGQLFSAPPSTQAPRNDVSLTPMTWTHSTFLHPCPITTKINANDVCDKVDEVICEEIQRSNYIITSEKPTIVSVLGAIPKPTVTISILSTTAEDHNTAMSVYTLHTTSLFIRYSRQSSITYQEQRILRKNQPQKFLSTRTFSSVKLHRNRTCMAVPW